MQCYQRETEFRCVIQINAVDVRVRQADRKKRGLHTLAVTYLHTFKHERAQSNTC